MLWFVVNTDLTITIEKVNHLFSTVWDDWVDMIGPRLGLPYSKRREIERKYRSPAQMREAYIDAYINDHPCPSWKEVSDALSEVLLLDQANEVERTYVQGTRYCHCTVTLPYYYSVVWYTNHVAVVHAFTHLYGN